jgi:hypothetical protein
MAEVSENIEPNHRNHTNKTNGDHTDVAQTGAIHASSLWNYMIKQANEKAKCNICNTILSRQNGGTTGLRKHLHQVHKIQSFSTKSKKLRSKSCRLSSEQKKKLDYLIIKCIVQDGRSFDDMRRPGILKVIDYLLPGKTKSR